MHAVLCSPVRHAGTGPRSRPGNRSRHRAAGCFARWGCSSAVVNRTALWSGRSTCSCTRPLPKVRRPTTSPGRCPDGSGRISLARAEPSSINTARGMSSSRPRSEGGSPPRTVTAFRVHDHPSFGRELIGQVDGRVEVASPPLPRRSRTRRFMPRDSRSSAACRNSSCVVRAKRTSLM